MNATRKTAVVVGVAAVVAAVPFMFLLFGHTNPDRPASLVLKTAPFAAPIVLGMAAYVYFMFLVALAPKLWERFSPLVGSLTGVLTFVSFAVVYPFIVGPESGQQYFKMLAGFIGLGLLLFGWIPIVIGGGAAWLGRKLFEEQD